MTVEQRAMQWIVGRDTGTSSKTIWSVMTMTEPDSADVPHDPDDFGRCYRLLALIPEWRPRLTLVSQRHKTWSALVREWDALSAMYENVVQGNGWNKPAAERLYRRMGELIDEGRLAAGWTRTGPNSWRGPGVSVVELGDGVSFSSRRCL